MSAERHRLFFSFLSPIHVKTPFCKSHATAYSLHYAMLSTYTRGIQKQTVQTVCRSAGHTSEILGRLQRRRAAAGAQAVARERKVSLMRKYRTGELPDVQQLSVAAFLAPLGTVM